MITVKYAGGLGNQMFQYAFARALNSTGKTVGADISSFDNINSREWELEIFDNIDKTLIRPNREKKTIIGKILRKEKILIENENEFRVRQSRFFDVENVKIIGYFQSPHYFEKIAETVKKEFAFNENDIGLQNAIKQVEKENSVAIHVRRGDYLKYPEIYGNICTLDYYKNAIEYINNNQVEAKFYVFSDDIEWAKEQEVFKNSVFVEHDTYTDEKAWMDMCLMSHCKHNIIANSSYSWWASYLNRNKNKIVIMPHKWDSYGDLKELKYNNCIAL